MNLEQADDVLLEYATKDQSFKCPVFNFDVRKLHNSVLNVIERVISRFVDVERINDWSVIWNIDDTSGIGVSTSSRCAGITDIDLKIRTIWFEIEGNRSIFFAPSSEKVAGPGPSDNLKPVHDVGKRLSPGAFFRKFNHDRAHARKVAKKKREQEKHHRFAHRPPDIDPPKKEVHDSLKGSGPRDQSGRQGPELNITRVRGGEEDKQKKDPTSDKWGQQKRNERVRERKTDDKQGPVNNKPEPPEDLSKREASRLVSETIRRHTSCSAGAAKEFAQEFLDEIEKEGKFTEDFVDSPKFYSLALRRYSLK